MDESELCVAQAAKFGAPVEMLVATRILHDPQSYRRWESEHAQLMRRVSRPMYLTEQVTALRSAALNLVHRKAMFEYLRDRSLTGTRRHRLMAIFHGFHDYATAVVTEHGNYLRGASSYLCTHHLARRIMKDGVFSEPLMLYQERYTDYFRVFCDVALAETDDENAEIEPMRALQPLLKLQLEEARREILTMPYNPAYVWREVEIRKPTGDTSRLPVLGSRRADGSGLSGEESGFSPLDPIAPRR